MSSSTSRFTILFRAVGQNELKKVRSVLRGIEQQSYTSLNAFNRNMSSMEKNTIKALNSIDKRVGSMNKSFRTFSMLGLAFSPLMAGFGALASATALVNRAFIQTNSQMQTSKILIEELLGNKGSAKEFVGVMQDLSASFGTDMSETMNSSRGLLQVMKQVGKGDVAPKHLDRMLKMVMAVGAMDIENRGLSYTAFSFKEAMQGLGQGDFRSLRNRLEINLGKETERAITKALKSGNLEEAINLFDTGLKRIGIDSEKLLKRLNKEGFVQNISRTQAYFSRMFQLIGEKFYYSLTTPIYKFNSFLETQFKDGSRGMQILTNLGTSLYYAFNPALEKLKEIGLALYNNREAFATSLSGLISSGGGLAKSMGATFLSFFKGLFGIKNDSKSQVEDMILLMKTLSLFADKATAIFDKLSPILKMVGTSIYNILSEMGKFAVNSGLMGAGGGLIGLAGTIASGIGEGIASILATINSIIGNQYSVNPNTGEPNQQSNLMQNMVNASIIGGVGLQLLSMRKGKVPTAIGGTTGATTAEASAIANAGKVGGNTRAEQIRLFADKSGVNNLRMNEIDKKIAQNLSYYGSKGADVAKIESLTASVMENKRLLSLNQLNKPSHIGEKNIGKSYSDMFKRNQNKQDSILRAKIQEEEIQIANLINNNKLSKEYTQLINERNNLLKSNMYYDKRIKQILPEQNMPKSSMFDTAKSYLPSLEKTAMGAMIIGSLSPIFSGIKNLFTGGGAFTKLTTGIGGAISKFGLLGLSLAGLIGALDYSTNKIFSYDRMIEDEDNRAGDEALKTAKIKKIGSFLNQNNIDPKKVNKFFDEGINGKKLNSKQLALMFSSPVKGIDYESGFSNEANAFNTLIEAFKNKTIDVESAKGIFSENAIEGLAGNEARATIDANLSLSGMTPQMQEKFKTMFEQTLQKVLADKKSPISGQQSDENITWHNQVRIMVNN
jgi:hypothetical protein